MKLAPKQSLGEKWSLTSKRLRSTGISVGSDCNLKATPIFAQLRFIKYSGKSYLLCFIQTPEMSGNAFCLSAD